VFPIHAQKARMNGPPAFGVIISGLHDRAEVFVQKNLIFGNGSVISFDILAKTNG